MANTVLNTLGNGALCLDDVLIESVPVVHARQTVVVHFAQQVLAHLARIALLRGIPEVVANKWMERRRKGCGDCSQIANRQILLLTSFQHNDLRVEAGLAVHRMDIRTAGNHTLVQGLEVLVIAIHDVLHLVRILGKPSADVAVIAQTRDCLRVKGTGKNDQEQLTVGEAARQQRQHGVNGALQIQIHVLDGGGIGAQNTNLWVRRNRYQGTGF